jgi:hypothetical protein
MIGVSKEGIRVRWLFLRRLVQNGSILETRYLPELGILKNQALQVKVVGKPDLEIRASAATLRSLGADLSRSLGREVEGVIQERTSLSAKWNPFVMPGLAVVLGLLLGFVLFRR